MRPRRCAGTFVYTPAAGTVPATGTTTPLGDLHSDRHDRLHQSLTKTVQLTVTQAAPVITWNNPASITYGTALSATPSSTRRRRLRGSFVYNPGSWSRTPAAGTDTLSVTFTPTDTTDYTSVNQDGTDHRHPGHSGNHLE